MKDVYKNLLIISGTGRDTGKTTLACILLRKFSSLDPVALKISPHWHEVEDRRNVLAETERFLILSEQDRTGRKDSSRMLLSGASRSYYIQSREEGLSEAFNLFREYFTDSEPVICESASLATFVVPAYHLCVTKPGTSVPGKKQANYDRLIINTGSNMENFADSVSFINKKWDCR